MLCALRIFHRSLFSLLVLLVLLHFPHRQASQFHRMCSAIFIYINVQMNTVHKRIDRFTSVCHAWACCFRKLMNENWSIVCENYYQLVSFPLLYNGCQLYIAMWILVQCEFVSSVFFLGIFSLSRFRRQFFLYLMNSYYASHRCWPPTKLMHTTSKYMR